MSDEIKDKIAVEEEKTPQLIEPVKEKSFVKEKLCNFCLKREAILGVDITPHYVRICQMQKSYDRWMLLHLASSCMENGFTIQDIANNMDEYVTNLKNLVSSNKVKTKKAAISIPHGATILKVAKVPLMDEEDLKQAITFGTLAQDMFGLPGMINEFTYQYKILKKDVENNQMDVFFAAANNHNINLFVQIVKSAGLTPHIVDINSLAIKNAFDINQDQEDEKDKALLFLEFGPDQNYALISDQNGVHSYEILIDEEEKGYFIGNNQEAISAIIDKYASSIRDIIAQYQAEVENNKVNHIYVYSPLPLHVEDASSTPLLHFFVDELSKKLEEYFVAECNFCNKIDVPEEFAKTVNAEGNLSAWAVPVGLATKKLDIFDCMDDDLGLANLNLLPTKEIYKKVGRFKVFSGLALSAAIIVLVAFFMGTYIFLQSKSTFLKQELSGLIAVKSEYNGKKEELSGLKESVSKIASLEDIEKSINSNQLSSLNAYKLINKSIPDGVWLKELDFKRLSNKLEIKGNTIKDENIFDFIKSLDNGGIFKKVSLKSLNAVKKKNKNIAGLDVKEFTLQCIVDNVREENKNGS